MEIIVLLIMISNNYQLFNQWGVWLSFSSGNKKEDTYGNNLIKVLTLKTWPDYGHFASNCFLSEISKFFPNASTGQYTKYEIDSQMRKIESVNFFKGQVQPTWEYGDNDKGGYFNFQITKDIPQQKAQNLYKNLIMAIMGNSLQFSDSLVGIRFVDTVSKYNQRYRIEVWLNYQSGDDANLDKLNKHGKEIVSFLVDHAGIEEIKLKYNNIKSQAKKQQPKKS